MPNQTRRLFTHSHEYIVWAVKGKGWIFNAEELKNQLIDDRENCIKHINSRYNN